MQCLKTDLHAHAADDPFDTIDHSAEMLIDAAAAKGVEVLAIAGHDHAVYTDGLAEYARRRNMLLAPAIERAIEGRHVLILNPDAEHAKARTFDQLRAMGRRNAAFIAPHPFYPSKHCLHGKLLPNIDVFDAIEYCSLYHRGINPNRLAHTLAKRHGLPMLGTSDTHMLPYHDTTFSWIEAEPTVQSVVQAIRAGRIRVQTRPRPLSHTAAMMSFSLQQIACAVFGATN